MRILFILLPILLLTAGANPVAAGIGLSPAATPLHMRAANADLIVLGRIEDVGEKDTPLTLGFDEVARTRRLVQLLDNPTAGLKSKEGKERMTTAVLMIYRYSGAWRAHGPRTRSATIPIDAEESNLILGVLAKDDWNVPPHDFRGIQATHAYHMLGLDPGALKTEAEAKAWLAQNLDTLRVRKAVPHEPEYIEDLKPAHFAKKSVWLLGGDEYYPWSGVIEGFYHRKENGEVETLR